MNWQDIRKEYINLIKLMKSQKTVIDEIEDQIREKQIELGNLRAKLRLEKDKEKDLFQKLPELRKQYLEAREIRAKRLQKSLEHEFQEIRKAKENPEYVMED